MLYREVGQFKTSYAADQAIFPIREDRIGMIAVLLVAFVVIPLASNDYWLRTLLTPFLIFALAAIGLNLLTGYAGQVSLGTGGFMGVGAYAAYNISIWLPALNIIVVLVLAGLAAAGVGILFGLPSLRIKGFYLAVATLAAQFFLAWAFIRVPWVTHYSANGIVTFPPIVMFGVPITTSAGRYLFTLCIVAVLALIAKNLVRGNAGRSWMAIRDMDIAAEIIGIRPLRTKLLAFAVSSFYCGIAGALCGLTSILGSVEPRGVRSRPVVPDPVHDHHRRPGQHSRLLPRRCLYHTAADLPEPGPTCGSGCRSARQRFLHIEFMTFGALIVFFLIVEPRGLARLWQIAKEKLRLWPFPH